jgi:hypothetical protein
MSNPDEEYMLSLPLTEGVPLYILASYVPTPQDVVEQMLELANILRRQVKPGTRIVSHSFGADDWEPVKVEKFTDSSGSVRTLYLWVVDDAVRPEVG